MPLKLVNKPHSPCRTLNLREGEQQSFPCLVRELDLKKLSKGEANRLCREILMLLVQSSSDNVVKVLMVAYSENGQSKLIDRDAKLYMITEFFVYSVHDLVRVQYFIQHPGLVTACYYVYYWCAAH